MCSEERTSLSAVIWWSTATPMVIFDSAHR